MRTTLTTSLIVLVILGANAAAQSIPASRAADAAQIKKEIEIISQAFVDKDRKTLLETHGKEWRGFVPEPVIIDTKLGRVRVVTITNGLLEPWALASYPTETCS